MRHVRPAPAWLPPFLVGASAAVAGEVAVGLLLYSGGGFLRALTLILATLLGAFALGLWAAPAPGAARPVEILRRRWLLVLLAFVGAAVTGAGWSVLGGLASGAVTRGVGLALLAAAPLYATGALLGTMGAVRSGRGLRGPGAAAAAGAAVGAVLTGTLLVRTVAPFLMHVLSLVALSAAALMHGRVLDAMLAEDWGPVQAPTGAAATDAAGDGEHTEEPAP